ncbi:DNA-binding protein [Pontibacter sp. JAM-7]|uniref:DNA-binding protein n=1 Tax=Pontibacter sp. JAM-7 TaxID=3366581 RepID=UPI003AF66A15
MNDSVDIETIYSTADRLLLAGMQPTQSLIAESMGVSEDSIAEGFHSWWQMAPERLALSPVDLELPEVPESLHQAFGRLWQTAVKEALSSLQTQPTYDGSLEADSLSRESERVLSEAREKALNLEEQIRTESALNEEFRTLIKALEAEKKVLKQSLDNETVLRNKESQKHSAMEHELTHLRKVHEEHKRKFDLRMKDEQRHTMDSIGKAEADARHFRTSLDKVREEAGKKEAALTRHIQELQAEVARKDVKLDMQKTQLKNLDEQLKKIKHEQASQVREVSKLNSQLLAEINKTKRLQDKIKGLEEELKMQRQKQMTTSNEHVRRENSVRIQYKDKDEELNRVLGKMAALEKKLILQDEEIRRLKSR